MGVKGVKDGWWIDGYVSAEKGGSNRKGFEY
jgi:hypothetical protein